MSDANGPISVQPRSTDAGTVPYPAQLPVRWLDSTRIFTPVQRQAAVAARVLRSATVTASAILLLSSSTPGATPRHRQSPDVAEAARKERARKQEQQKPKQHVYTNEDLARAKILIPEDQARVEGKKNECAKNNNCAPTEKPQDALDANSQKPGTSVGEVARQYRKQKENQKELDALKPKQSEPFHLPSSEPAFASPILPMHPAPRQPLAPVIRPGTSSHVMRRDPFARVPVQPARPEAKAKAQPEVQPHVPPDVRDEVGVAKPSVAPGFFSDVRPAFGPVHGKSPRAPTISPPAAPASLAVQPAPPAAPVEIRPSLPDQPLAPTPAHPKAFASGKPIVPDRKIRARRPKAPMLARPVAPRMILPALPKVAAPLTPAAPATTIRSTQPEVLAPAKPAPSTTTMRPTRRSQPAPTASTAAGNKVVSVKRGDSLWKVAQQNLGSGRRWPELAAANPWIANPNQIQAGAQLALPTVSATPISNRGTKNGAATIQVHKGDTLWSLAKTNLGRWSAWPCLAGANPTISDPKRIQEGQKLSIPSSCHAASGGSLLPGEK